MTRLSRLAIALLLMGSSAIAEPSLETTEIIEKSGLTGLSYQARNLAQQALNDSQAPLGTQLAVVSTIAPIWGPQPLQQVWQSSLAGYSQQQRTELLRVLDSPALLRARNKEQQAINEQDSAAYQHYLDQLQSTPPLASRYELIRQLDNSMHFSALLKITRSSVSQQLTEALPDWQLAEDWQSQLQQSTLDFLFYVHRSTSNAELQRLINIYQTPILQTWLQQIEHQLAQQSLKESVAAAR